MVLLSNKGDSHRSSPYIARGLPSGSLRFLDRPALISLSPVQDLKSVCPTLNNMVTAKTSQFDEVALQRRRQLTRSSGGPAALVQNVRVFLIALFACIGGLLYGYNQGVFSGVLTMTSFNAHMGVYTSDQTKKGWLTSILELGAWFGTLYSGFLAEFISRKYAIIVNTGIFILGVIIQCTATTSAGHSAILGGRFIVGMVRAFNPVQMLMPGVHMNMADVID